MPWHGGLPDVPCARCGTRVRGLAWGNLCPTCTADRTRRASQIARRIAIAVTLGTAVYVGMRLPADPMARYYGVLAVAVTYLLVRRIAQRLLMEVLR